PSPSRLAPNGKSAAAALGRPAPARDAGGPGRSPERSVSLRYVVLAVVGALIVIAAGTFAVGLVGGREEPAPPERVGVTPQQGAPGTPSSVTFSVLNGTGVDGVAKQVADELEAAGYRRGNVTNASEQKAESVVLYARTARADALAVAREIDVSQTEPIDAPSQALAGDASVVVVVGADQTQ
ncbi:MAG: LytR C-terminal domain-containing protein, partial [Actinomycetota bacterium]|nr:LytR C-terminal domain-containing protein [Actinomycetota bacterium]